jgi:hypothetical protein
MRVRLTRDSIQSGSIRRLIAALDPSFRLLREAEIRASLDAMLRAPDPPRAIWVFAYGSLMWNPAFEFVEQRVGLVHGFHRRFCLWTHLGRGSPGAPGLMLALEPGGSCRGVVYRIAADAVATELEIIWRREMLSTSYVPRWVRCARRPARRARSRSRSTAPTSAMPDACRRPTSRRRSPAHRDISGRARSICSTRSRISRRSASATGRSPDCATAWRVTA